MKKIKAYYAWPKYTVPLEGADIVFARNAKEARLLAYKHGDVITYHSVSYIEINVRRYPEIDWWAELAGRPCCAEEIFGGDPCFQHDAYGHIEGLESCINCGRPDTSLLHPDPEARKLLAERWRICPKCGHCRECGCACKASS